MPMHLRFFHGAIFALLLCSSVKPAFAADTGYPTQNSDNVPMASIEGEKKTVHGACAKNDVDIGGDHLMLVYVGHCGEITLKGNQNTLTFDEADELTVIGDQNVVRYHRKPGDLSNLGSNNTIESVPAVPTAPKH